MALARIKRFLGILTEPDISPGSWFIDYSIAWANYHNIPHHKVQNHLTSGIVEGAMGWIWVTATPSFDRYWFASRGFRFPRRWLVWDSLSDYEGLPGDYVRLDL